MLLVNKKSALVSIALIAMLSSCGKSKELKNPVPSQGPASASQQQQRPSQPVLATQSTQNQTTQSQNQNQSAQNQAEVQKPATPIASKPSPKNNSANNSISNDSLITKKGQSDLNNNQGEILPPLPAAPAADEFQSEETSVISPPLKIAEKNKRQASQVNFSASSSVPKTGGRMNDLYYTSAGRDGLMEEFKSYNTKVAANQQTMNLNLAKNIVIAKLSRQTSTNDIIVNLTVDEFGTMRNYRVKGKRQGDRVILNQEQVSNSGALEFQGGFLKCLDIDGGCENSYVKLKFSGAYARVIFRNSLADMHFLIQQGVSNNQGFELLRRYAINAETLASTSQRIDTLQVASFEVVNGRAGMGALLTTTDKEMIGLSIPLVASAQGTQVNVPIAKLTDLSRNYDLSPLANTYSQRISSFISAITLVNNDGQGQLKLRFSFNQASTPASIWMQTSRVQKSIMSLDQVRNFENTVKFF